MFDKGDFHMNKAVTEGLDLMPPAFVDGLDVWSSGDGTAGTVTYATNADGSLYASDPDFGDCFELITSDSPQRVRYMGETPIIPGCYLEITARVKLVAGPTFPGARISAYAGDANGVQVTNVPELGPLSQLSEFGRVYTLRAIVGSGERTGVDMVWGTNPVFGHVGVDVLGDPGTVVRIESIRVEDKTSVFHRKLLDVVDVRDFGALGDGVKDDSNAFETADANAAGRVVIVPEGTYFLGRNVTMTSPVRFTGTVIQPDDRRLALRSNFDFPTYAEAYGDETLGFKKGLQALFYFNDHEAFDLGGRTINLTEPIDVFSVVGGTTTLRDRRVLRNGQLVAEDTAAWAPDVVTSTASYSASNSGRLTDVAKIGSIAVGSLVEGFGVGREVYVRAKDEATGEITLSQPLYNASGSQSYTFTRNRYMLDFSGFTRITSFNIDSVQFLGEQRGCGVMLPPDGIWWIIRNCWFTRTGVRGITSPGTACQGITIDQCEFLASDADLLVQDRTSVGFNTNKNDAKIRDNRCINLKHFGIIGGNGNLVLGNHFWQLDTAAQGERTAGLILTDKRSKTTINGNYIDNQFIEFSNEYQNDGAASSGEVFGRVSIVGNIFTGTQVPDWFRFIVMAPKGTGHKLVGINVVGNTFQLFGGSQIDRVDAVDTSQGSLNFSATENLVWEGNAYGAVSVSTASPALVEISRGAANSTWQVDTEGKLPFGGHALGVDSVTAHGPLLNSSGGVQTVSSWVETQKGAAQDRVDLRWTVPVTGTVQMKIRVDKPGA